MLYALIYSISLGATFLRPSHGHATFKDLECRFSDDYCAKNICSKTSNARNTINFLNIGCYFRRPVDNIIIHITLFRKHGKSYTVYFLDVEESLCGLLEARVSNKILNVIFDTIFSRLRHIRCPFKGNITVSRVPLLMNLIPAIFTDNEYKISAYLLEKKSYVFGLNVTFVQKN